MSSPDEVPTATSAPPPDWLALAGVVVTAILSCTPVADLPGSVFIAGACLFWAGYVVVRVWRDPSVLRRWGFRGDNLGPASVAPTCLFLITAAGLAGYAAMRGTFRFPLHTLPLFLVYAIWGLTQQFLVLGIVARNLLRIEWLRVRPALVVLLVASLFGLFHAFNYRLVAATFFLELVLATLYLRHENLWPLGMMHGWLGGLFYLWALNRDLWAERFG